MKIETLEEAMESYLDSPLPHSYKRAVEFGAKWQQERIYISDLDISIRLLNVLTNARLLPQSGLKITFLDEIAQLTKQKIYSQPNCGKKAKIELAKLMEEHNIKFKEE